MLRAQPNCGPRETTSTRRQKPRYWSGWRVGLFVLTLAVFHWGMHYRLSRYEASQNKSHPMAKMWLGDKSYVAAATVVLAEQGPALTIFMAFLGLFPDLKIRTFSKPGLRFLRRVVRPPLLDYGHALLFRPPPILACL